MQVRPYSDSIFINCPFDAAYEPILHAIIFTIYRCGFSPQCALGEDDGTDNRLDKIMRCVKHCQYSIHDLSRIEINEHGFPRFNMPFELGLFFGAKYFGNAEQKKKNAIIFEREKYTYLEFITDLRGVDVKAHGNDPEIVIEKIRNWLKTASNRRTIPSTNILLKEYTIFKTSIPVYATALDTSEDEILFNDFCLIVEEAVKKKVEIQHGHPYPPYSQEPDVVNDFAVAYF